MAIGRPAAIRPSTGMRALDPIRALGGTTADPPESSSRGRGTGPVTPFTAPNALTRPAPHCESGSTPWPTSGARAVSRRICRMSRACKEGFFSNINAMVPVTCGAAIDVPWKSAPPSVVSV